jgi:hypothetical protein
LTITQGLAGAVSEYCLGRREAADGGAAAAAVVVGVAADGDVVDAAAGDAVPEAAEMVPGASGEGPGVQAARADRPAPAISSLATARRLGRSPGLNSVLGPGGQL